MVVNKNNNDLKTDCSLIKSLQIRAAGEIIEHITDYHILETLLNDFTFQTDYYRKNEFQHHNKFQQEGKLITSKTPLLCNTQSLISSIEDKKMSIKSGKLCFNTDPYIYLKVPIISLILGKNHTRISSGPYIKDRQSPLFPIFLLKEHQHQQYQIFIELNQFAFFVPISNVKLADFSSTSDKYLKMQLASLSTNKEVLRIMDSIWVAKYYNEDSMIYEIPSNFDTIYGAFINNSVAYRKDLEDVYIITNAERLAKFQEPYTFKDFCLNDTNAKMIIINSKNPNINVIWKVDKSHGIAYVIQFDKNSDDYLLALDNNQYTLFTFDKIENSKLDTNFINFVPLVDNIPLDSFGGLLIAYKKVILMFDTYKYSNIDDMVEWSTRLIYGSNTPKEVESRFKAKWGTGIILNDDNAFKVFEYFLHGLKLYSLNNQAKDIDSLVEENKAMLNQNITFSHFYQAVNSFKLGIDDLTSNDIYDGNDQKLFPNTQLRRDIDYNAFLVFRQVRFRDPQVKKKYLDEGINIQGRILEIYNKTTLFRLEEQYSFDIYDTSIKKFYFFFLNGEYNNNPTMRLSNRYSLNINDLQIKINGIPYLYQKIVSNISDSEYNEKYISMLAQCFNIEKSNINEYSLAVNLNTCDIMTHKIKNPLHKPFIHENRALFKNFDMEHEIIGKCIFGVNLTNFYELIGQTLEKKKIEITFDRDTEDNKKKQGKNFDVNGDVIYDNEFPMEYEMYVIFEREKSIHISKGPKIKYE